MPKRILFVADQPFEINFFIEVASLLSSDYSCALAIVDFFTFNYGPDVIKKAKRFFPSGVYDLEAEYRSWQIPKHKISDQRWRVSKKAIDEFSLRLIGQRDIETILRTDAYTNNFEFASWQKRVPKKLVDISHADSIQWALNVVNEVQPDLICGVSNTLLPSSLIFEISLMKRVPHFLFSHTRIGSRWVKRIDFSYGMNPTLRKEIIDSNPPETAIKFAEDFKCSINSTDSLIYPHIVSTAKLYLQSIFESSLYRNVPRLIRNIFSWLYPALRSVLLGPRTRKFRTRYFDQSFIRLHIFELKRIIRPFFASKFFENKDYEGIRFFLWPLHYRPEGVVLVQGNGLDEIKLISQVAKMLPENTRLFVKENPLMVGIRSLSVYKDLERMEGVTLVSPISDSIELIKHSIAVIGLTGTALLEGQLVGKPSWALGSPEFLPVVHGTGLDDIQDFMLKANQGQLEANTDVLIKYIAWIFQNSNAEDHLIWASFDIADLRKDIERISMTIRGYLENI
jgi:hypothetical protein